MSVWTIFQREMRAYFFSPIAWVLLTLFSLYNGIVFYIIVTFWGTSSGVQSTPIQAFFGQTIFFYLPLKVFSAAITGRLLAEERRSGTIETLLTAPVTDLDVVLGKYLAAWLLFLFLWLPSLLYVWMVEAHADLDWGPVAGGYLGTALIGAVYIAIGLLMSAASKSQIVAMTLTFGATLCLFALGIGEFVFSDEQYRDLWSYINLWSHMESFSKGIVDTRHLVYYGSLIGFSLAGAVRVLEARRWST